MGDRHHLPWISAVAVPVLLTLSLQQVAGFSSAGRVAMTKPFYMPSQPVQYMNSQSNEETAAEEEYVEATIIEEGEEEEEEDPFFKPEPPKIPPMIDAQLERDLRQSERRIMLYEKEIEMVREQLDLKQDELVDDRTVFRDEKSSLLQKVAEFTNILAQRDDELEARTQAVSETKSREDALSGDIKELNEKLEAISKSYENEKKVTTELQKRYSDSQDALEFEQMSFQREKQALQLSIEEQKKALKVLESKVKQNEGIFDETRKELLTKIEEGEQKLSETKEKWEQTQQELAKVERELRESLQQREKVLKESRETISQERGKFETERKELRKKVVEEEGKVADAKKELNQEQKRFASAKQDLELLLKEEQEGLSRLQNKLIEEQAKFESEKVGLELRIRREGEKLARVEKELSEERDTFSREKEGLENRLAEEIRVGKLKKRVMNERYNEIRKEMTDLWEGAKRDARKEEGRLKKKYEKKIGKIEGKVVTLEDKLDSSMRTSDGLRIKLAELQQEKWNVEVEKVASEKKYDDLLLQRDTSIIAMQSNVDGLMEVIRQKELFISEQDEQIVKYETSFRQVARLSVQVTGNKLKGVGGRLKRLIQNSPPPPEDLE
jgi:chromosome segregation ATPase